MFQDELDSLRQVTGAVHHFESFGAVDGPGLRFVLFLQGCPMRCLYCHNPDSQPFNGGKTWTAGDMLAQILQYRRFIKRGGVTFSGGEPLMQPEFVAALSALLHLENVHVALDTSGCQPLALSKKALDASDLVLLDIKATDPQMCLKMTGMDNTNAFETLDYLERIQKPVWIRHVLLRGYTLDKAQLALLARKLQNYGCIQKVELLPFHKLGEVKWEMMDRPYMLKDIPATTRQELDEAKAFFAREGFSVQ